MNTSPIRATVGRSRGGRTRAEMDEKITRRIVESSDDIGALRKAAISARHYSEHETVPRGLAREAAKKLLKTDHDGAGESFAESMEIVEASFPDAEMKTFIGDLCRSFAK